MNKPKQGVRLKWAGSNRAQLEHQQALNEHPPVKKSKSKARKIRKRDRKRGYVVDKSIPYKEYLQTVWWIRRRRRALRLAGWKCLRCGDDSQLEVHHLSYKNLWKERDDDLEVLCSDCHYGKHAEIIEMDNHLRSIMNSVL